MARHTLRTRAVAAVTALAIAGGGSLLLAPPASAGAAEVTVATTNPFVNVSGTDQPIGSIGLTEVTAAGDVSTSVCVEIIGAGATFDTASALPTVTDNTDAVAGVVTRNTTQVSFPITTPGTAKTTFAIAGLVLDVGATAGQITAKVGKVCGGTDYEAVINLAFAGTVDRIQGADRYATAVQIAENQFNCAGTGGKGSLNDKTVVITRGDTFPDALSASFLAGKNDAPILLTAPTTLAPQTETALRVNGIKSVVLIGGTVALSAALETYIDNLAIYDCAGAPLVGTMTVSRITGPDRYATAQNVAESKGNAAAGSLDEGIDGACGAVKTAIVASGENFPDALAVGGLAYTGSTGACGDGVPLPLLLTPKATLSGAASGAITNLAIKQVILLGGPDAIAAGVQTAIDNIAGVSVVRVSGATRQATAVEIANKLLGPAGVGGWNADGFLLSRPDTFPDALAASALSGRTESPIYLTDSTSALGATATGGIASYPILYTHGTLLGGATALTDAVGTQAKAAIAAQT